MVKNWIEEKAKNVAKTHTINEIEETIKMLKGIRVNGLLPNVALERTIEIWERARELKGFEKV